MDGTALRRKYLTSIIDKAQLRWSQFEPTLFQYFYPPLSSFLDMIRAVKKFNIDYHHYRQTMEIAQLEQPFAFSKSPPKMFLNRTMLTSTVTLTDTASS